MSMTENKAQNSKSGLRFDWQDSNQSAAKPTGGETGQPANEGYPADPEFQIRGGYDNPMVDAAMPLFGLVMRLRTLDELPNIEEVYAKVRNQISTIQEEMRQHAYEASQQLAYSYALCLHLDEAVMGRPWGRNSCWSQKPLLSVFHHETWGGEKVFTVLSRMMQETPRYLLAICDQAILDDEQRDCVKMRFGQQAHPLLQDPRWQALHPYSPLLIAAREPTEVGHRALLESFPGDQNHLSGWIVSAVPGDQLARHLAQATAACRPQGDAFLLRFFDPYVLPALYQHADSNWWDALVALIVSWWVPKADTEMQRWGRIAGHAMTQAAAPSALLIDDTLWQALVADPLPHQLLKALEQYSSSLFDTHCPGIRLARIEALIAEARNAGLSAHGDLHDYVFITLAQKASGLEDSHTWQQAIHGAASGKGHLGDLYLALRNQTA